ncbi:MAG: cytochrome c3 family protein [Thermodesulfobacteriota bacterium]
MIKVLSFLMLVAAALVITGSAPAGVGSYHDFTGRCLDCHIKRPLPGEQKPTLRKDITALCTGCHKQDDGLTHPVDVEPVMEVPGYLPLDWRGMVTCVTCHEVHKHGFGPNHMRTSARGQGFCMLCHGLENNKMHGISGVSAHRGAGVKLARASYSTSNPSQGIVRLDEMSIKCMSCHDATFGPESLASNLDVFRSRHSNVTGLTHPVGVSYAEAKRKYRGAYRNISDLPPQIKFYGGMVGCGTCHSPYSGTHAQLVMDNYGSNLCLACHVK